MAQNAITSIGGDVANASGSLSFSAGEVAVRHSEARAITVVNITEYFTEGVQQAFASNKNDVTSPLPFKVMVFPNPTQDFVEVSVTDDATAQELQLTLFSLNGEQLLSGAMSDHSASISLANQPAGSYMLRIDDPKSKTSNVYKIIKK